MAVVVIDTSALVDHLRGHAAATRILDDAAADGRELRASVVTKVELLWNMRASEKSEVRVLIEALEWSPVSDAIAETAGRLARRFRASHASIDLADYVIGATAIEHAGVLWTCNVEHFPMFEDLEPPYV